MEKTNQISHTIQWIQADSLHYMKKHTIPSIVTGVPDMDEVNMNESDYAKFLKDVADLFFRQIDPNGFIILMMTDRKHNGWIDKTGPFLNAAEKYKKRLLWHKIIINRPVGSVNLFRPTYSNMICFGPDHQTAGIAFPDVIERGYAIYQNGNSVRSVVYALQFLKYKKVRNIIDPFAGIGTVPLIAKYLGISSIAIEIDPYIIGKAKVYESKKNNTLWKHTNQYIAEFNKWNKFA